MGSERQLPSAPAAEVGSARLAGPPVQPRKGSHKPRRGGLRPREQSPAGEPFYGTRVVDLRGELADDSTAPVDQLNHPLPARAVHLACGRVDFDLVDLREDCFGILVLEGLLLAELDAGRAHAGWLVGSHDLIRPWGVHELVLTDRTRWQALLPSRVALLDHPFGLRAAGIPMVARVLVTRAARTSNWLLAKSLVLSSPVIEERLLLLFALLAERWGRVTADGVVLHMPLTHAMLATLCGARRPSVTLALGELARDGLLSCTAKGSWLLHRAPTDAGSCRLSCAAEYERALGMSWPVG
jgi:hypothetical protein